MTATRPRGLFAAAIALSLLALAAPVAAGSPFRIVGEVGHPCLKVENRPGSETLRITQKRPTNTGTRKLASTVITAPDGSGCVTPLRAADILVVTYDGVIQRTVSVPRLSVSLQPGAETVRGRMPTDAIYSSVAVLDRTATRPFSTQYYNPPLDGDGGFLIDVSSSVGDLTPGDGAMVSYGSPADDAWQVRQSTLAVAVRAGSSRFTGVAPRSSTVRLVLKRGATVRGTATVRLKPGRDEFAGDFRRNGAKVKVKPGDRVLRSGGSAVLVTVIQPQIAVVGADHGSLTATCRPNQPFAVVADGTYAAWGTADGDGIATATKITGFGPDLPSGTVAKVWCQTSTGSGQLLVGSVP